MKNVISKHWYGLVSRPDGTLSRTNITTTIAWIIATIWISYTVYQSGAIGWELLTTYLAFATGQGSFHKYLAVKRGENNPGV